MKLIYLKLSVLFMLIGLLCQCNSGGNQNSSEAHTAQAEAEPIQEIQHSQVSDLPTINIEKGQTLESPIKITVNSEGKWGGFEGELGTIELFDDNNNTIGLCILSTTENWMVQGPVNYYCDLVYHAGSSGNGRMVIKNNNPTGEVEHDKSFVIPIKYVKN